MSTYVAPIRDMQFVLKEIAGLEEICALPGNEELSLIHISMCIRDRPYYEISSLIWYCSTSTWAEEVGLTH